MGMYDYVKIKTDLLPISDYYKTLLGEYNEWQTKDYLCELGGIELREDGTVWYIKPKPIIIRPVYTYEPIDPDYCETLKFYGNDPKDKYWFEFSVEIEDGKWFNLNLMPIGF